MALARDLGGDLESAGAVGRQAVFDGSRCGVPAGEKRGQEKGEDKSSHGLRSASFIAPW
jgi:hypothetical protein